MLAVLLWACGGPVRPDGWYLIEDGVSDSVARAPVVTVEDFDRLRLDSVVTADGLVAYQIVGRLKKDRIGAFARATERAVGHRIGFLYEGTVLCCPRVNMRIDSGSFAVTPPFFRDASRMKALFRALEAKRKGSDAS